LSELSDSLRRRSTGETGARMPLPVAVIDPAASYRLGLTSVLSKAGFVPFEDADDLPTWLAVPGCKAVLVTVRSANDWEPVRRMSGADGAVVVALLVDPTPDRHAEALRAGATAAIAWDSSPDGIVEVVTAAVRGYTLLPAPVARAIAMGEPPTPDADWISPQETEWLRMLAAGITIQELAAKAGYSERAFYRVLHGLYGRMRVSSRTEAILQASRWGLLEDPVAATRSEPRHSGS
jgi:two-component system, NarL family, response regulator DesR